MAKHPRHSYDDQEEEMRAPPPVDVEPAIAWKGDAPINWLGVELKPGESVHLHAFKEPGALQYARAQPDLFDVIE
jgi:hypothetical protein